jgi:hypothetical protein
MIDNFLTSLRFKNKNADPNLYELNRPISKQVWKISSHNLRKKLVAEFEMKYLGMMPYFLGPKLWQRQDEIFLNQGKYTI